MATKTKRPQTPAAKAKAEAKDAAREQRNTDLKAVLEGWLAEASEEDIAAAVRTFSDYSPRNACLIRAQDEDATRVHSYLDWLDAGRRPRPREEGSDGDGITIVGFRGDGKSKEAREQAEAAEAAKKPGEISSDDLKPKRRFYDLRLVYDIRHTDPTTCRTCQQPIHRTGFDPENKRFHTWTHDAKGKADHEALPTPRETAAAEVPA